MDNTELEEFVNVFIEEEEVVLVELNEGLPGRDGEQGPVGPAGPKGDRGDVGPMGPSGGSYLHDQENPALVWTIQHNLGYRPTVTVLDENGVLLLGWKIVWESDNVLLLRFPMVQSGIANAS